MADVFISYARADAAIAGRLAKALQGAGLSVWWDADLPAHRAYSEEIERNLTDARAVVVLWSKSAAASQWVRAEADMARNAGKLVQAQVDGTLPPLPFNQIQCADLKGWRGSKAHPGWAKLLASAQSLVSGEARSAAAPAGAPRWHWLQRHRWWVAAALALLVTAAVVVTTFRAGDDSKPVLAVLPFKSLDARDESLVAGMWEDTRRAIGRNPQLVVLGPNTAEQLASKGEEAASRAADYVLQASVRTAGDRIRISTDLVRTEDGAQLWSQSFDRKLDDVFALQTQIAGEIEGRIRGRLAQHGGVKPEHIATRGEVYALYSDARLKLRKRDFRQFGAVKDQLEQVVRMDPNFAPGWASLSVAYRMLPGSQTNSDPLAKSEAHARKAIELAPNLAAGHAALALALGFEGPVARQAIERAVQLDPSDHEAVMWLGNTHSRRGDKRSALAAYVRAAEMEPLFWPAVLNQLLALQALGDEAGIEALIAHEQRLGADHLVAAIKLERAISRGALGEAANVGLAYLASGSEQGQPVVELILWPVLLQLGLDDIAAGMGPTPPFGPPLWRNDPKGLDMVERMGLPPRKFFGMSPLPQNAGRVYVLSGRSAQLADLYLSLGMAPPEFAKLCGPEIEFVSIAPIVAVALSKSGHREEAARLLAHAEQVGETLLKSGEQVHQALLARIYAALGRKDKALALLASAVSRNWLPTPPTLLVDLALDPALAALHGDPRFERIRQQILGTIKREQAQVRVPKALSVARRPDQGAAAR